MVPERAPNPLLRLLRIASVERAPFLVAIVSLVVLSTTQLYVTWLIKDWVEGPVLARQASQLRPLLVRAIGASLAGVVSLFLSRFALAAAGQRLLERLRNQACEALLNAPVSLVGNERSGEWLSRLFNDLNALTGFLSVVMRRLVGETLILSGSIILMFILSWRLTLATLTVVPLVAWLFVLLGRRIREWSATSQRAAAVLTATINEQLRGFTTVKAYQAEALFLARIRSEAEVLRRRAIRGELWSSALISLVFLVAGGAFLGILLFGTTHIRPSGAEQAAFLAFCLYAGQTVEPARRLGEVHGLLQQSIAAALRVFEVIDLKPERAVTRSAALSGGSVRFDRVDFSYRPEERTLRNLSFALADGEMAGLVGASGCGKTTLARLLVGFEEPGDGQILLAGSNLGHLSLGAIRRAVCLVEQDPFLLSGPMIENIRFGFAASRATVEAAIAWTGLDALVATLPRGLDSPLREAGRDLSGGERQRLALARAVVRDPRLVILDEATSSIDSETEASIFTSILPWLSRRTVLVISHRLSTVQSLQRVLLMDAGRIVADGHPDVLAQESLTFRALFGDQLGLPCAATTA